MAHHAGFNRISRVTSFPCNGVCFGLFLLLFSLFSLLPNHPAFWPYPSTDSGVFLYGGSRLLHGETPYVDFWDNKPPLIFLINALGLVIGTGHADGVWVIEVLARFIGLSLCFVLLRQLLNSPVAFVTTISCGVTLLTATYGGNHPTHYAVPLQFGSYMLLWASIKKHDNTFLKLFAIGSLGMLAFMLRQTNVGLWIAIALYFLISWRYKPKLLARAIVALLCGAGVVSGAVVIWLWQRNALQDFWLSAFVYNTMRTDTGGLGHIDTLWEICRTGLLGLFSIPLLASLLPVTAIVGLMITLISKRYSRLRAYILIAAAALVFDFLMSGLIGGQPQYSVPLIASCAVLSSISYSWLINKAYNRTHRLVTVLKLKVANNPMLYYVPVLVLLMGFGLVILRGSQHLLHNRLQVTSYLTSYNTTKYLQSHVQEGEEIIIWGNQVGSLFLANLNSPTRFVNHEAVTRTPFSPYAITGMDELVDLVKEARPLLIIDSSVTNPAYPPLQLSSLSSWEQSHYEASHIRPFLDVISEAYVVVTHIEPGQWPVYVLKENLEF